MKERVLEFMKDMESNDPRRVSSWFTEASTLWIPPCLPVSGLSRINALFRALFSRYINVHWTVVDIFEVSPTRCLHICDSWGEMKGRDNYSNRVITDITFDADGKISYLSDYFKDTAVFHK